MDSIKTKMDNYICNICNKVYSSYKSLWNHNKEFHKNNNNHVHNVQQKVQLCHPTVQNVQQNVLLIKSLTCEICNKIFNSRSTKSMHKKKCIVNNNNNNNDNKIEQLEEKNKILEDTINELKKQVSTILEEKGKIHHKTLQKINNQLTNNINNNGNINNGKIINNTYVKFGDVDYQKILDNKQVKHILNQQFMSLEESIKLVHFNKDLPEYNNVFITNMRDDIGYIFNGTEFISIKKNEMLNELIDSHVKEINLSLEKHKNKLNEKYVNRLEKFLDMLNDDDTKFTDQNNQRTYPSYKAYKINSLKLLIYNSSDKKKLDELNSIELKEKVYTNEDEEIYVSENEEIEY
jgi:hypothetical protein